MYACDACLEITMSFDKRKFPVSILQRATDKGYIPFAIRDAAARIRNPAATADKVWTAILGSLDRSWTLCESCANEVQAFLEREPAPMSDNAYDTFVSYASEDVEFANQLVGALLARGLKVWYAPQELKVGDRLLSGIEDGLRRSRTGTLVVSAAFLQKPWTGYELDILLRQAIERGKQLLQVWYGVTKDDVERRYMGLTGLMAIDATNQSLHSVIESIAIALTDCTPLRGTFPLWESPLERFLSGKGEIQLNKLGGPTINLFELLVNFDHTYFPLALDGRLFSRRDLAKYVKHTIENAPESRLLWHDKAEKLIKICAEEGLRIEF